MRFNERKKQLLQVSSFETHIPFDKSKIDVIVADDEVTNRMVAAMNLGMSGFDEERIHECEDGEEAINILKNLQDSEKSLPVIVLLYLHMPGGLDGMLLPSGSERIWINSVIKNRSWFAAQQK